jgi:hypothetical protein
MYMRLAPFCVFALRRLIVYGVSGQPIGPICKFQAAQQFFMDFLALASLTDCDSTLRNIPEERRSHLHLGRSLWSHTVNGVFVSFKDTCFGVKDSRIS